MARSKITRICPHFHVKKRTLLAIAGCVWLVAGFNVARLGVLSYEVLYPISVLEIVLSATVFAVFGFMFLKMSTKHKRRIAGFEQETRPVWHFFDLKSYIIMGFMMGAASGCAHRGWCPTCSSRCSTRGWGAPLHRLACCSGGCSRATGSLGKHASPTNHHVEAARKKTRASHRMLASVMSGARGEIRTHTCFHKGF